MIFPKWVMSLAKKFDFDESASIAFDRSNANERIPNPYYKQKERTNPKGSLFFCLLKEIVAKQR